ncbi:MAG: hypothetical protein M0Q15_04920, partial [Nevskia sp.]|nr:hypothetical protein [Nevskia sp.]
LVVWRLPEEKKAVPRTHGFTAILRVNLLKENRLMRIYEGKPQYRINFLMIYLILIIFLQNISTLF